MEAKMLNLVPFVFEKNISLMFILLVFRCTQDRDHHRYGVRWGPKIIKCKN